MAMLRAALPALLLTASLVACDSDPANGGEENPDPDTITQLVVSDPDLSSLEAAVLEANIDDDLATEGPFTVFAPTNAAFDDLLDDLGLTLDELLERDDLVEILALHVVSGAALESGDLEAGDVLTTRRGETLTVVAVGSGFGLDTEDAGAEADARLVTTDLGASNGVVHKINAVMLPTGN